jgi:hypothetical protein
VRTGAGDVFGVSPDGGTVEAPVGTGDVAPLGGGSGAIGAGSAAACNSNRSSDVCDHRHLKSAPPPLMPSVRNTVKLPQARATVVTSSSHRDPADHLSDMTAHTTSAGGTTNNE